MFQNRLSRVPMMKVFTVAVSLASWVCNGTVAWAESETDSLPNKPDIILVMSDDQGWGQTGYNGHPTLKTPALDAMSEAGLTFDRFYAGSPVCSPTRAAVLTGRTPVRTGVPEHGYALRHQEISIAAMLRDAGYATSHFGKWHLDGIRGPGVPVLKEDRYGPAQFGFSRWLSVTNFFDRDPLLSDQGVFTDFRGDSSEVVVDAAIKHLRSAKPTKPQFAVIWFGSPHSPFIANQEDTMEAGDVDDASKQQFGELVAMDRAIGKLRKHIHSQGRDTLLWFCSDNGGLGKIKPSSTGDLRGNKGTLFEGGIRVPAIIEWPSQVRAGSIVTLPCGAVDIFPTIADVAGITPPVDRPIDGISIRSWFENEPSRRQKPMYFHYRNRHVLIDQNLKLIADIQGEDNVANPQLYQLDTDRTESKNLYQGDSAISRKMAENLATYAASVDRSRRGLDYPEGRVSPLPPSPQSWTEMDAYQAHTATFEARSDLQIYLQRQRKIKPNTVNQSSR